MQRLDQRLFSSQLALQGAWFPLILTFALVNVQKLRLFTTCKVLLTAILKHGVQIFDGLSLTVRLVALILGHFILVSIRLILPILG